MHVSEADLIGDDTVLTNGTSYGPELQNNYSPHVGIIGAGISGLRCAEHLINHGIKVTIIEARDRIGGRICQSNKLGYAADIGPNWIHTSGDNPILQLANQTNTPLHVWNDGVRLFDKSGKLIKPAKAKELDDLRWTIIDEAFKYSSQYGPEIPASESLYDFFVKRVAELDLAEDDREILLGMCQMWGDYTGDPIQRQSLKYVWLEEVCGGEECIVTSSFAAILAKVAEIPLKKATIQLNTRAISFKSLPSGDDRPKVEVGIQDGESQFFDEVVVTCPLGWLKKNKKAFDPSLDIELSKAIDAISIGHLEKVYIAFPTAFWRNPTDPSQSEIPDYTNWLSPTYAPETNPHHWPQEAYDISAFAPPNNHPTLLLYTFGPLSAHISSIAHQYSSDAQTQHQLLSQFFTPYISLLPNYSPSSPACTPTHILATAWQHDDLAGNGSYCNLQIGIEDADRAIEAIQKGMPERGVWFAGEHASPFEELGTAAGAWVAGARAAGGILEKYSQGQPKEVGV